MITDELYKAVLALRDSAQGVLDEYHKQRGDAFAARLASNPVFAEGELVYSKHSRCPCGRGLAYPVGAPPFHYWDCAGLLTGTASKQMEHTGRLPFIGYEIESEQIGATTRPPVRELPKRAFPDLMTTSRCRLLNIEKQPDYETRIKEYEQEAVFLRERHIALQAELQASEIRFQEERARILQIIEKEKHWVEHDFQSDIEDSPNSVGAWICERIAEEIETYPHLACLANTENKLVNENDGDWRDKAYRGEDY